MRIGREDLSLNLPHAVQFKREFRDAFERRAYLRACLLGKRRLEEPALVTRGGAYLDRFVRADPRQRRTYALWTDALQLPVGELVAQLLADDAHGAALRETAPVFVVIPAEDVRALEKSAA